MNNPILQSEGFEKAAYALKSSLDGFKGLEGGAGFEIAVLKFETQVTRLASLFAMQAANLERSARGMGPAYGEGDFFNT